MTHPRLPSAATCLVCGTDVNQRLSLGTQPLANALLAAPSDPYQKFPLGLASCPACTHGQLTHFIDPELLFTDYLYASGTSGTLRAFFGWFSEALAQALPAGASVVELASNDGSLLDKLRDNGLDPTGIDPAGNLCEVARKKGHDVMEGFFPEVRPARPANAVVAMNVAAHTPNLRSFMSGVAEILAPDGVAIIQTSQALMLGNGEFDTVYHEHYSFFTVASMARLAELSGLYLEQVRLVSVHGTSFLFFLRRSDYAGPEFAFNGDDRFAVDWPDPSPAFLSREFGGTVADATYTHFASDAEKLMADVRELVASHRAAGRRVGLVGIAAKALTFMKAAGIEPDACFDEADLKIGRYVPGAENPIRPLTDVSALDGQWLLLIGAWNFADELARKIRTLKPTADLRIVAHLPSIREIAATEAAIL